MRNLLAFLAAAVIAFLGLGWYLDWYKIQSVPSVVPGHQSYNFELDKNKIEKDARPLEKKIEKGMEGIIEKKTSDATAPPAAPKAVETPSSGLPITTPVDPNAR